MNKNYINIFNKLSDDKLIKKGINENLPNIGIYKYGRKVFYDNLWGTLDDPILNKVIGLSRGIVLSDSGDLISFPFDKVFNYGEIAQGYNTLPEKDKDYVFVEKLNGFLGVISQHPYDENDLLIHTQGSIKNHDYSEYIRELLTEEQEFALISFMKEYGKHTFMFEVIHPNDPHVIDYKENEMGLYLIGIRDIRSNDIDIAYNSLLSETEIDNINNALSERRKSDESDLFKRPYKFVDSLENVLRNIKEKKNLEGYMIRDLMTEEYIAKLKTPNYLIAKFLGRMNDKKYDLLFSNLYEFKKSHGIEEEFYPIIDYILEQQDVFELLTKEERVLKITDFINNNY